MYLLTVGLILGLTAEQSNSRWFTGSVIFMAPILLLD